MRDWASQEALVVDNLPANADVRDASLIPGLGRSPGRGHDQEFFNRKINHSHPVHSESGAPVTINTAAHVCCRLRASWV